MIFKATRKERILGIISFSVMIIIAASAVIIGVVRKNNVSTLTEATTSSIAETSETEVGDTTSNGTVSKELSYPQQEYYDWIMQQIAIQNEADQMMLEELSSGTYSLDTPLVVLDPYNCSPLTAILLFTTDEPVNISIHIPGREKLTSVDFVFDGYLTEHMIPVYGLYADTVNQVVLTAENSEGEKKQVVIPVETQPLPEQFDMINTLVDLRQPDKIQPGFTFSYNVNEFGGKTAFDANGEYRWFLRGKFNQIGNYNINGRIMLPVCETTEGDGFIVEVNPLGKIFKVYYIPYGIHHDIELYRQDTVLVTGYSGEESEDFLYELNLKTGEIDNSMDLKNVLQRTRTAPSSRDELLNSSDWAHINAIVAQDDEGCIIISSRTQSAIIKMTWPEGEIKWISSRPEGYLPMFDPYVLQPVGLDFEYHYAQHAPYILPDYDNNPDTLDILVFDNGWGRPHENRESDYSRMVQYRIDEKAMTIEQIRQYGKEQGEALFSDSRGDADLLSNGNWLGAYYLQLRRADDEVDEGVAVSAAVYVEIDDQNNLVWMAQKTTNKNNFSYYEYRSERMEIYSPDANHMDIGKSAINLIPEEIQKKYGG